MSLAMSLLRAAEENLVSTSLPQRTEPRLPEQRGTDVSVSGNSVRLVQEHGTAAVILDEEGSLLVIQPAIKRGAWRSGIASIIEEEIQEQLTRFFGSAVGSSTIDPAAVEPCRDRRGDARRRRYVMENPRRATAEPKLGHHE